MGRILRDVEIDSVKRKAIFDTGSPVSYIKKSSIPESTVCVPIEPIPMRLAGQKHICHNMCLLEVRIQNKPFSFHAYVIDDIGTLREGGKVVDLDILVGVTAMEEWDIYLDPKKQTLNLKALDKREIVSF